jgi:hypothetical protein
MKNPNFLMDEPSRRAERSDKALEFALSLGRQDRDIEARGITEGLVHDAKKRGGGRGLSD